MNKLFCVACGEDVDARLTNGSEIYPHRIDLKHKCFWVCDACNNYVGCHPGRMKPLGVIPTDKLRKLRSEIHAIIDPIWRSGVKTRAQVYKLLSNKIGKEYHTANIASVAEAENIIKIALEIKK